MVASPEAFAAVIQVPVPSLADPGQAAREIPGAPLARKPKKRLPCRIGCDRRDDLDGVIVVAGDRCCNYRSRRRPGELVFPVAASGLERRITVPPAPAIATDPLSA